MILVPPMPDGIENDPRFLRLAEPETWRLIPRETFVAMALTANAVAASDAYAPAERWRARMLLDSLPGWRARFAIDGVAPLRSADRAERARMQAAIERVGASGAEFAAAPATADHLLEALQVTTALTRTIAILDASDTQGHWLDAYCVGGPFGLGPFARSVDPVPVAPDSLPQPLRGGAGDCLRESWELTKAIATTLAGAAVVTGGVAAVLAPVPEPGHKVVGWGSVAVGAATVTGGMIDMHFSGTAMWSCIRSRGGGTSRKTNPEEIH